MLPKPEDISRATWQMVVLPNMHERLGEQTITSEDWSKIEKYFSGNAPVKLAIDKNRETAKIDTSLFHVVIPELGDHATFTSLVKIDENEQALYYGNAQSKSIYKIAPDGSRTDSFKVPGVPMTFDKYSEGYGVLTMDNFMPGDGFDSYYWRTGNKNELLSKPEQLVSDLLRATHAQIVDLNGDNKDDLIISSFGREVGELAWYEDINAKPVKHILNAYAGMIRTVVYDFNHDGQPDIFALAAQGDERILLYENERNGNFKERTLLRFPPSYGSTYFDLVDFNRDGIMDILYVNGDNGDYSPIAKSYHGVRIFTGSKDGTYQQTLFLPLNGAFKAVVEDFDLDKDLDIAAISYFPDYENRPGEGFVFFENAGNGRFRRHTIPESLLGKWIVMDSGDIDNDGDKDIVIGSAMFLTGDVSAERIVRWGIKSRPILILENKTRRK